MPDANHLKNGGVGNTLRSFLAARYARKTPASAEKLNLHYFATQTMLDSVPLRREAVERIDPANTVVLLLAKNLPQAILHYAKYCDPLPDFYVIDYETYEKEIRFFSEALSMIVMPVRSISAYGWRKVCLFVPEGIEPGHPDRGFYITHDSAVIAGILPEHILFNSSAFMGSSWLIMNKALPATYLESSCESITRGYAAMADEESKSVYAAGVKARITGNAGYMPASFYQQYYHPLVQVSEGDFVIEGGIECGNTTVEFAKIVGDSGKVIAFEPDPSVYDALESNFAPYKNIVLERQGLWSKRTTMELAVHKGGGSTFMCPPGENKAICPLINLDTYMQEQSPQRCDMIKLDIEGAEAEMLKGSIHTLRTYRPKLAISVYHYPYEQFVGIVQFLLELDLGYTFYMGHHMPGWNETTLYSCAR
jgi:FkbM family methyltransferase